MFVAITDELAYIIIVYNDILGKDSEVDKNFFCIRYPSLCIGRKMIFKKSSHCHLLTKWELHG